MITSVYRGGLGNQLFQIATGYMLAKQNDDTYAINPNLQAEWGQGNPIHRYIDSIFKNIDKTTHRSNILYKEPRFNYTPIEYQKDLLLDGYFQTEKYFPNARAQLNELFGFATASQTSDICTIHIRTGDYLHSRPFNVVTPKYFETAMRMVLEKAPSLKFFVVTDDVTQAKRYLPHDIPSEFKILNELDTLHLISESDYSIISNSSFGWWGSYLGKEKITIAPATWFRVNYDVSDVFRTDMIKIDVNGV